MIRDNIELIYCPAERMINDYFIKPIQGSLFRITRDIIMGPTAFPEDKRVGNNQNMRKILSGSIIDT